jgi:DNA-binding GntR family transcriptional regulator
MAIVDNRSNGVINLGEKGVLSKDGGLLADRAYAYIRTQLADGVLGPGSRLNELEISQHLGISRGPVREAIRRLTSSGLAIYEPNAGARVVSLGIGDVAQLYEVREALEARAAGLAAHHMTNDERETLIATLDEHEARMTEASSTNYPRGGSDWDFHLLILKGARNAVIWRICGDELRDMFSLLRNQHGSSPGRGHRALQEHRWIAEAIVAGNADFASLLMAQHIRASRDNLLSAMRTNVSKSNRLKSR